MIEKTLKMYLPGRIFTSIFASELQTILPLRNFILTLIIILWNVTASSGQQIWPGDINNNGIVNNIDVLYWAVAKDATGAARQNPSTNWVGQDLPASLWDKNFPTGLNYAYADCDGDGDVDDDDKTIIENNFGSVQGAVIPDVYATGDPGLDPILQLSTGMGLVPPGGTLDADLSLGVETDSISDFYGIAFTVAYDPNVVGKQGNAFQLDILENTWMNGAGNDKVIKFLNNDRDNGIVQIAIVRKNQVPVSGFGDIGTVSIVMEDIVVGLSNIAISDIKTIDLNLTDFMVAPSDLDFTIDSTLTPTVQLIRRKGVKLYPNPVIGEKVTIELDNPAEIIRQVQLFDSTGRLLQSQDVGSQAESYSIDVNPYASGIYTLKIFTNKHIYVQSFFR